MVELLCSYGAHRRPHLLAHDNDLETAAAVFAANSALADDVEALGSAASNDFVRLLLRHRPRLPERVTVAKDPETNELLFRHRMDPGRADWLGVTPLHRFARDGRIPIAVQFLSHGASIHARDEVLQSTPLGYAAKFGKRRMVEFLLRRGARVRLPDDPPWAAPEAWARRRGHTAVAELLRHHERWGADPEAPSVESLESLAAEWAKAFDSHDADALARLSSHFEWDRRPDAKSFREMTRQLLRESTMPAALDPARSREVLARMLGFVDWGDAVDRTRREERLGRRAAVLLAAERARVSGDEAALERLVLDNPETLGPPEATLSVRDVVRRSILREHRFDDWDAFVRHRTAAADPTSLASAFEAAVDAVVDGDLARLRGLLEERGDWVRARSERTHRATLLHYIGANGVEDFRQRTPPRAVEIAELLLDHGAEVDAVANMYGGATVLGLVATSVHPHRANLQIALLDTLLRRGATLDPQDAGAGATLTVNACLANGRYEAAAFLATRGARLDLEGAAGVGDPNRVLAFFDDTGRLRPEATEDGMLSGFHWACEY
ncbi:MAG: ankyrin repeat domain-containing protein, partial [Verrucomicrobiales bacterium]|nr:ankyrin repeat domain-containing protein [Verrucomicrobiales bacterium]